MNGLQETTERSSVQEDQGLAARFGKQLDFAKTHVWSPQMREKNGARSVFVVAEQISQDGIFRVQDYEGGSFFTVSRKILEDVLIGEYGKSVVRVNGKPHDQVTLEWFIKEDLPRFEAKRKEEGYGEIRFEGLINSIKDWESPAILEYNYAGDGAGEFKCELIIRRGERSLEAAA